MGNKNRPHAGNVPFGNNDWKGRTEFAPEYPPYNDPDNDVYSSGAASSTDFTGLTTTEPRDGAESEALRDIADMPTSPKKKRDLHT